MRKLSLNISLSEIIQSIPNYTSYKWYIMYFNGFGAYSLRIENAIKTNKVFELDINDVFKLENDVIQIIDMSLVAFKEFPSFLDMNYDQLIKMSDVDIELVDSSYWEVSF